MNNNSNNFFDVGSLFNLMDDLRSNPAFENATIRTSTVIGPSSLPECLTSTECGSNFNCVDGKCVQMDTKGDITAYHKLRPPVLEAGTADVQIITPANCPCE